MIRVLDGVTLHGTVIAALRSAGAGAGAGAGASGRPVGTRDLLVALMRSDNAGEWHRVWLHSGDADAIEAKPLQDLAAEAAGTWQGMTLTRTCLYALEVSRRLSERYRMSPLPPGILALGLIADDTSAASRALGDGLGRNDLITLVQDAVLGTRLGGLQALLPAILADSRAVYEPQKAPPAGDAPRWAPGPPPGPPPASPAGGAGRRAPGPRPSWPGSRPPSPVPRRPQRAPRPPRPRRPRRGRRVVLAVVAIVVAVAVVHTLTRPQPRPVRMFTVPGTRPVSGGARAVVAFSPDGKTLATGDLVSGRVKVWDTATGHLVATLTGSGHSGDPELTPAVDSVAFSPNGRVLAAVVAYSDLGISYGSGYIGLWNTVTWHLTVTLAFRGTGSDSVAFSPDGRTLAAGGDGISLWDVATGRPLATLTARGDQAADSVAFSPDGKTLAGTDGFGDVSLWDLTTGHRAAVLSSSLTGGGGYDGADTVAFSPDGNILAVGDNEGATLWNVATRHVIATLTSGAGDSSGAPVAFSPDGKTLAAVGNDRGGISLWDVATRHPRAILADPAPASVGYVRSIYSVAFSPGGKTLATGDVNGATYLWNAPSSS
jgi:WD domain, G-beta repeat